ncbi:hypothetical protein HCJ39_13340 [Listeria rocourtiae]|uniref:hypothetical protein n=1 Tax=Listeria rocourtiae TaxID=647910 RepID=UPI001623490A|nr:hypothetical protein [Listeria rocourtiae]MBC1605699.1 hypothetical protein [Listeria rocourtiae]
MKLIAVNTQEKYDALMKVLDMEGYAWFESESKPSEINNWENHKEETVIVINTTMILQHQKRAYFENVCPNVKIENYEV